MARSPIKPITNNLKPVTKFFSRTQKQRKNRIELARQCMEEEQWSKAIKQWRAIIKNKGNETPAKVYLELAHCYFILNELNAADDILIQGKKLYPQNKKLLKAYARSSMTRKEWKLATTRWKEIWNDLGEPPGSDVFRDLARCLQNIGESEEAQKVLCEGIGYHLQDPKLYLELFYVFLFLKKREEAKIIADALIELEPKKKKHLLRAGKAAAYINDSIAAESYYKAYLEKKHNTNLNEIMEKVRFTLPSGERDIQSEYFFGGGYRNLGVILHSSVDSPHEPLYFTKICNARDGVREVDFYKNIYPYYPELSQVAPPLVSLFDIEGSTYFITTKYIEGTTPDKQHLNEIIKKAQIVNSIKCPESIKNEVENSDRLIINFRRLHSLIPFFRCIHKEETNKVIFSSLFDKLKEDNCSVEIINLIKHLETIIVDLKLYEKIIPQNHFVFLHGDLGRHNILVENNTNNVYVLDWSLYTYGPRWIDLIKLFARFKLTFEEINTEYYIKNERNINLDTLEELFFTYGLIISWFIMFPASYLEENKEVYLVPAVKHIESLANNITPLCNN